MVGTLAYRTAGTWDSNTALRKWHPSVTLRESAIHGYAGERRQQFQQLRRRHARPLFPLSVLEEHITVTPILACASAYAHSARVQSVADRAGEVAGNPRSDGCDERHLQFIVGVRDAGIAALCSRSSVNTSSSNHEACRNSTRHTVVCRQRAGNARNSGTSFLKNGGN